MDYHHVNSVAMVVVHKITFPSNIIILIVETISSHTIQDQLYVTAYKDTSVQLVMIMMVHVKSALLVLQLRLLRFLEVLIHLSLIHI